jgi:polyribonucleotide nucleotidyltransferase
MPLNIITCLLALGFLQVILETGEIGRQANGAVMATMGETVSSGSSSSMQQQQQHLMLARQALSAEAASSSRKPAATEMRMLAVLQVVALQLYAPLQELLSG